MNSQNVLLGCATTEARLATIDQEIAQLRTKKVQIKRERLTVRAAVMRGTSRLQYLQLARRFRAPAESYDLWHLAVLLVGPIAVGAIVFVLVHSVTNSFSVALWGSAIFAMCAVLALIALLYYPSNLQLQSGTIQAKADFGSSFARLERLNEGLAGIEAQLHELLDERSEVEQKLREELAGPMGRRAALLKQDWMGMRGTEWEEFLIKVFRKLGAIANRIGGAGDQGVDLIAEIGTVRIAVQAKGWEGAVNNKAVQEAFAGMTHYRCNACVVITNSRFTPGAIEIAGSTNCFLIGRVDFPAFVMGTLDLERSVNAIFTSIEQDRTRAILLERIHQLDSLENRRDTLADADARPWKENCTGKDALDPSVD